MGAPRGTVTFGTVRGATIELEDPVPDLDGERVRVELIHEPSIGASAELSARAADPEGRLTLEEHTRLWRAWKEQGPDGPLSEEDAGLL